MLVSCNEDTNSLKKSEDANLFLEGTFWINLVKKKQHNFCRVFTLLEFGKHILMIF